jgi:uncharacterized protein (DUF305 family)
MKKPLFVIAAAVVLGAAACGGNGDAGGHSMGEPSTSAPAAASQHNDQDVLFAQLMIPHHQQAIEMSEQAATRAAGPEVKELARQIEQAQGPEIKTMTGWLTEWGAELPGEGGGHGSMGHGSELPGMMSEQDMAKLNGATGAEFDRMFLSMMIEHHEGAIAMAKDERAKGSHAPAKAMAGQIITAQNAEITKMRQLLE